MKNRQVVIELAFAQEKFTFFQQGGLISIEQKQWLS